MTNYRETDIEIYGNGRSFRDLIKIIQGDREFYIFTDNPSLAFVIELEKGLRVPNCIVKIYYKETP
jgi:hypothetical protein